MLFIARRSQRLPGDSPNLGQRAPDAERMQTVGVMGRQFSCSVCGSASIRAPQQIADDATILCGGCGHPVGTWAELKGRAKTAIAPGTGFQHLSRMAPGHPVS